MIRTIHKFFWGWNYDKEERWLNEMAASGLVLSSVGFCRYDFTDCIPGEYKVRIELLKSAKYAETEKYIGFLEETGVEHVGNIVNWAYFRKKTTGEFELFSDNDSRVRYLTRIIRLIGLVGLLNLWIGGWNLFLYFANGFNANLFGLINLAICLLCVYGAVKLLRKRSILKKEQQVFES